jgi:hypothetical protein
MRLRWIWTLRSDGDRPLRRRREMGRRMRILWERGKRRRRSRS